MSCPSLILSFFFFNDTATTEIYTLSLHDALPIFARSVIAENDEAEKQRARVLPAVQHAGGEHGLELLRQRWRSEEHTSELQSRLHLVCRLLLEKKKKTSQELDCTALCLAVSSSRC